jgi:hypothetical protein
VTNWIFKESDDDIQEVVKENPKDDLMGLPVEPTGIFLRANFHNIWLELNFDEKKFRKMLCSQIYPKSGFFRFQKRKKFSFEYQFLSNYMDIGVLGLVRTVPYIFANYLHLPDLEKNSTEFRLLF